MTAVDISLRDVAKTWPDGSTALHPLSLDIPGGETLALLGPSGCGKTTLLRMIAGLERPDAGASIRFGHDDVTAQPPEARGVGMVFQHYALFPAMDVLDNVAYGLRVRGVPRAERDRRAREMLALVQLESFAGRQVSQLSGGQRQRVALARALAIGPRVLLLDEPLTALDAKLREQLRTELARMLRSLGITTVIVTHDQDEAMVLGQRIAVMSAGCIEQVGPAETLYRDPGTPFVAGFLGSLCDVRGALADGVLVPGEHTLRFRPHEAVLEPASTDDPHAGRIDLRHFLGTTVRLDIVLPDGQRVHATVPADTPLAVDTPVRVRLARTY